MPDQAIPSSETLTSAVLIGEVMPAAEAGIKVAYKSPPHYLEIQTKLTVGAPDDPYEKETYAVAERVVRIPESFCAAQSGKRGRSHS